ncbi:MAG: AAA family ATPase [Candidatus Sphingomonas phytovorans]|nr:AAA family ATPase [Sphingomonas sp.]WEJ99485.1 MAG: AAA family ATPase [Sphingomonas sp.]
MDIRITGWRCQNIRGNLRDVAIDLTMTPPRWTLIQMSNGGGKTTTTSLIRAALTGVEPTATFVKALRPEDGATNGTFELNLLIDGALHRIQLLFDYLTGNSRVTTSRAATLGGGMMDIHSLPADSATLKSPEFVELFVFDGELARKIRDNGSDRASKAIETLYGIDKLGGLRDQIEKLLEAEQKRVAGITQAKEKGWVQKYKTDMEAARAKLVALEKRRDDVTAKKAYETAECDRLTKEIGDQINQNKAAKDELEDLESQLNSVDLVILQQTGDLRGKLISPFLSAPHSLERLRELGSQLQELKLPEAATAEFFHELSHSTNCVCDREITPEIKEKIVAKAATFMGAEESGVLNSMKTMVRSTSDDPISLDQPVETLRGRLRERQRVTQRLHRQRAAWVKAGGIELSDKQALAEEHRSKAAKLESELERIESDDPSFHITNGLGWEQNIPKCREVVAQREETYNTSTQTHKLLVQSRATQAVIQAIEKEALNRIKEKVRQATNLKIAKLVPGEQLQVVRIGKSLELSSRNLARKDNVSEGQSLSIAYAFLASLFETATHRLPFVIDSPAIPLDSEMRREVIKVVPELFEQTIMFVISTERKDFAERFYGRDGARFITLVRGPDGSVDPREGQTEFDEFQDEDDAIIETPATSEASAI